MPLVEPTDVAHADFDLYEDADASSLIVPFRTEGHATPIFCVHSPLGSTGYYANLARALPSNVPFYGINAVGAFGDELPLESFEAMAQHYIRAIRAVRPRGPYVLAGHSSGAYIAFEMCLRLGTTDAPRCIVIEQDAPTRAGAFVSQKDHGAPDMLSTLIKLLTVIATLQARPLPDDPDTMRRVFATAPEDRQLVILADWLKQLRLLPQNAGPEMAGGFLCSAGAHGAAEAQWSPRGRSYDGLLCVVQANDSVVVLGTESVTDPTKYADWQSYCTRPMRHFHVPGNHLSLMIEPYVAETARCIQKFLAEN